MDRMKLLGAALATFLLGSGTAFAAMCGTQGVTEGSHTVFQHTCYEFMFNNSGGALTSGTVVILDTTGTGLNQPSGVPGNASRGVMADVDATDGDVTNVGTYITTTTTVDDERVIGVVDDDSCADQTYCRVQTYGSRLVRCNDATDPVGIGTTVSTSAVAGECGDAANDADGNLGLALEDGDSSANNSLIWIFINPSWTD